LSKWNLIKRRDFIRRLKALNFTGPFSGSKHQFMIFENHRLTIPSNEEYSVPQLRMMIREVNEILKREITIDEWNSLQS
jgi:hypothetical protein